MSGDGEIRERARGVTRAFMREAERVGWPMSELLRAYASVARCVGNGEYHREIVFRRMVGLLREMGAMRGDVDTDRRPRSESVREAAQNARRDTLELYQAVSSDDEALRLIVDRADDLMESIPVDCVDGRPDPLHDAVTAWIAMGGGPRAASGAGEAADKITDERISPSAPLYTGGFSYDGVIRDAPERVIFNPPATVAFWPDGTKTVAKCADGEGFSEYTGLLVAIAKRHLKVPRHAMFEDAMAKLLKRAERQAPRAKGAVGGDAA